MTKNYYIVNDTRYDNHHGCLTVIENLKSAMKQRGWNCIGSLPVSSSLQDLERYFPKDLTPDLIIVNGEGTLHHDGRNCKKLLTVCKKLQESYSVVLINALWQDVDDKKWRSVIDGFKLIYTRDMRSQLELNRIGVTAKYAPDLTFYQYPEINKKTTENKFAITDSVLNSWTEQAYNFTQKQTNIDLITLFTGKFIYRRGFKDTLKAFKSIIYPFLWEKFKIPIPPRYKASTQVVQSETHAFLGQLNSYEAICVARYHAMCFALQQRLPFVFVRSNSHKSEALAEEVGLPVELFSLDKLDLPQIEAKLIHVVVNYHQYKEQIDEFCCNAKQQINQMFDTICQIED